MASIAHALFVFLMNDMSTPAMYFSPVKGGSGENVRWEVVCTTLVERLSCSLKVSVNQEARGIRFPFWRDGGWDVGSVCISGSWTCCCDGTIPVLCR